MSAFLLALALLPLQSNSTTTVEGVWVNERGQVLMAGNNRVDWQEGDRYFSSMVQAVPDGTLLGQYISGRDVYVSLEGFAAANDARWGGHTTNLRGEEYIHLSPNDRTFSNPFGEARITPKIYAGSQRANTLTLDYTPTTSRTPVRSTFTRAISMDNVGVGGRYADKDVALEVLDEPGRVGMIHGSISYLGKKFSISGRRIMGRAGFLTFDDSRVGLNGQGSIVWAPSPSRAVEIRNRNADGTDQVEVYFRIDRNTTAAGIHKTLRRQG